MKMSIDYNNLGYITFNWRWVSTKVLGIVQVLHSTFVVGVLCQNTNIADAREGGLKNNADTADPVEQKGGRVGV